MSQKQTDTTGTKVAVGVGLAAAAAAAAAGAYWFYGSKDAKAHRKQAKSWMLKARAEVMERVENLEDINKEAYLAIVQEVLSRYTNAKGVTAAELAAVTKDLKGTWSHMHAAYKNANSGTAKKAKKAVKKAVTKAKKKITSR